MALQPSGTITMGQIRTELKQTGTISLGSAECRKLAKVPSGAIKMSDFYGKSNTIKYENHLIFNQNIPQYVGSYTANLPNYILNGKIKVEVNFKGVRGGKVSGMPSDGRVSVYGVTIQGSGTKTVDINLKKGDKTISINNIRDYFEKDGVNECRVYNSNLKIYFTGETEA